MYDNVSFYLESHEVESINLLEEVLSNGSDITVEKLGETGTGIPFGYVSIVGANNQKLTFKIFPYSIWMSGKNSSICKYYLGDNFQTLTLEDFNDAILNISEKLGVDITKARVSRIDLATNFYMEKDPSNYHSCLTHLSRFTRGAINGNLYFKTTQIELNFYDKKKEYRQKRVKIPEQFKEVENVLRYEIRFKKNISKLFKRKITISDLCGKEFFSELYHKWKSYYWNITKQNPIVFDSETTTMGTKDFKDYFFVQGMEATGGVKVVYDIIEKSKKAHTLTSTKASYLRSVVSSAYSNPILSVNYDYVEELNDKMSNYELILK